MSSSFSTSLAQYIVKNLCFSCYVSLSLFLFVVFAIVVVVICMCDIKLETLKKLPHYQPVHRKHFWPKMKTFMRFVVLCSFLGLFCSLFFFFWQQTVMNHSVNRFNRLFLPTAHIQHNNRSNKTIKMGRSHCASSSSTAAAAVEAAPTAPQLN